MIISVLAGLDSSFVRAQSTVQRLISYFASASRLGYAIQQFVWRSAITLIHIVLTDDLTPIRKYNCLDGLCSSCKVELQFFEQSIVDSQDASFLNVSRTLCRNFYVYLLLNLHGPQPDLWETSRSKETRMSENKQETALVIVMVRYLRVLGMVIIYKNWWFRQIHWAGNKSMIVERASLGNAQRSFQSFKKSFKNKMLQKLPK